MTFDDYLRPDVAHLRAGDVDRQRVRRLVDEVLAEQDTGPSATTIGALLLGATAVGGVALYLAWRAET